LTQAGTSDVAQTPQPSAIGQLWRTASAIERRSSRAAFVQPGMYIALTIGLLLGSVLLHNSLRVAQLNAVLTTSQPLLVPLFLTTILFSIYVASRVALEITRERANRTLEVLFYGPVDANAFLLGHWIGGLKIYAVGLVLVVVWMNLVMWLLNIAFDLSLLALLGASLLSTAAMIAFGMFVGSLGGRSRNTLILFIGVVLLFVVIQAADVVVRDVIPTPEGATANDPTNYAAGGAEHNDAGHGLDFTLCPTAIAVERPVRCSSVAGDTAFACDGGAGAGDVRA
jgi:MFS family permease